jgi:hypothetical protein
MSNKEVLSSVYKDMVQSAEWWSVGQLVEKHGLTISQRDYLRQVLYSGRSGFVSNCKKVDGIIFYRLSNNCFKSEVMKALGFRPTSSSTFLLKHG